MMGSYSNPIRGMERHMAPNEEERQFRMPGLSTSGLHESGLGSLKHTMPHLRRSVTPARLQGGGQLNPVGETYASTRPNLYNPDPMRRRILQALKFSVKNPNLSALPGSGSPLPYADGGMSDDDDGFDPQDLMQPDDQQSGPDDEERQIVLEAMAALEGLSGDPTQAIDQFVQAFGPRALKDLQQMVETKHRQEEQEDEGDGDEEDDEGAEGADEGDEGDDSGDQAYAAPDGAAGGGLLAGPGTGQSDEIEGVTPSGRPVLLSDGEYVFDAPTVAALGDGSTNAGARRLDDLRRQIRNSAYGHEKQAKPMKHGGLTLRIR